MKLKALLLIFVTFVLAALVRPSFASTATVASLVDQKVVDVELLNSTPNEQLKTKINSLKGTEFSAVNIRQIIQWFHESGSDASIQFSASKVKAGIKLFVEIKDRLKVSNIVFIGNKTVNSTTLISISDIKEGVEFENEVVAAATQKISLFYSKQGYLASDIRPKFNEHTGELAFHISEGEPTLIGSLAISQLSTVGDQRLQRRFMRDLRELFGIKVGDRIQRDLVLEGVQNIKDWLREHDFLTSSDPALEYKVNEDGKVDLNININYGPRIRYGFRGNQKFSYRELMSMVGEIKEISSSSDYLISVRRRVLDAYKDIGYANAKISTLVREDSEKGIRYVSLIIEEGEKIKIDSFEIEGVASMSPSDARKQFDKLANRLTQRDYFHEGGLNKTAELFADYLKSKGYLSAKLEFSKFEFNAEKTKVKITFLYSEGIQTIVDEIKINGASAFSESEILNTLALKKAEPFDIFAFERGLVSLKNQYQEIGNLSALVANEGTESIVRYNKDNSKVSIQLDLEEGPVFRVGEIAVKRNVLTHARVILRELPFITGDVLTKPLLIEAEDNLRRLGLFANVIVSAIDRPGGEPIKDILILVDESEPGAFEITPGFRNDLGLRFGLGFSYQNIGGWNRGFQSKLTFNRRLENYRFIEYRASFAFREPYLAGWPVAYTANLEFLKSQLSGADVIISRITNGIQRELTKHLIGSLEHSYERIKVENIETPKYRAEDARTDYIGSITPGLVLDYRNDPYNPTSGLYSVGRFEVASQFFGSSERLGYYRASLNNSIYLPLLSDLSFAIAGNIGYERSNVSNKRIPITKLYRLGGMGSIRGYADGEINVDSSTEVFGTLASVNYRGEFRYLFTPNVGMAAFLDAGNLLVDRFTLNPDEFRSAVGAGFRYNTPFGPVVLDFAWRMQTSRQVGDTSVEGAQDRFKVHFAIGSF